MTRDEYLIQRMGRICQERALTKRERVLLENALYRGGSAARTEATLDAISRTRALTESESLSLEWAIKEQNRRRVRRQDHARQEARG